MFATLSIAAYVLAVVTTMRVRGRAYATFVAVVLGLHTSLSIPMFRYAEGYGGPLAYGFAYAQVATYLHFTFLAWPRLRPTWYRLSVSVPASFFAASLLLSVPWAIASALGSGLPWPFLPFLVGAWGLRQSFGARVEGVHVNLDGSDAGPLARHTAPDTTTERPLRIVQITDPHLGPFMSPSRLARICQRAVDAEPDLIALTGDFLTMESQTGPGPLSEALAPLKAMPGRVFACFGNHDHESPALVRDALASAGVRLLVDQAETLETDAGPVQILGADFLWRGRREQLTSLAERFPRAPEATRLWLLHDPSAFVLVPEGEADLVLSGHTHGGQLGLVSLGLPHTLLSLMSSMPDHGLWARGTDRLYVHRGTGHYGFPIRLGVPAEESVLHVHGTRPEG